MQSTETVPRINLRAELKDRKKKTQKKTQNLNKTKNFFN